jgi:hypothetical protein
MAVSGWRRQHLVPANHLKTIERRL